MDRKLTTFVALAAFFAGTTLVLVVVIAINFFRERMTRPAYPPMSFVLIIPPIFSVNPP